MPCIIDDDDECKVVVVAVTAAKNVAKFQRHREAKAKTKIIPFF